MRDAELWDAELRFAELWDAEVRDAELWEAEARPDLAGSGSGGLYADVDVKMATALEKDLYIEMMLAESWKEIFGEYNQLKLFTCMRELLRHEFRQGAIHSEVRIHFRCI